MSFKLPQDENEFNHLDECIDKTLESKGELFSIANLIRGHNKPVKRRKTMDLKPIAYVRFNTKHSGRPRPITLKALLDSGGSGSLIASKHAKKLKMRKTGKQTVWTTPGGALETTQKCKAEFTIPELHDNRLIEWNNFHVTKDLGAYDMIIGRDILRDLGIDIKFSTETCSWDSHEMPFKDSDASVEESYFVREPDVVDEATERLKGILDAKYEAADLQEVASSASHLTTDEQENLHCLLSKYASLFDGTLGNWKDTTYNIELKPDAEPYHARAFPIPRVHTATLKMEVERLCELGVLKKVNRSEWAAPTFIIPKKDGSVRFISDFRELNKRIRRKPFPIPKIQDLMMKLEGFQFGTSLDLNMGYYHIELNPDSKKLCTIVLPFGKYEYQRLPMGLCNSPDIFQEKMSELMEGLEFVRAYIDDLLCITNGDFGDHLEKLELVFQRLQKAGLKVNAKKSFFGKHELEYLGYWITREGIQPLADKVKAMHAIKEPKNKRELRRFIGIVNYYRDMWIRRSHLLAPLASLTSKKAKWRWQNEHRQAFEQIKKVISKETLLAYPNFDKPFVIHTDASHTQLGAVISQDNRPIAFYSRKLNPAQTRYTTTERELLSIVETLKEFRNILLGQQIVVHTDHKNLTCKNFNTERVMRWRLLLEEYGPELRYIKGEHNIVADALSRLDMNQFDYKQDYTPEKKAELFAGDDSDLPFPKAYPLTYAEIAHEQALDKALQSAVKKSLKDKWYKDKYDTRTFVHNEKEFTLTTLKDGKIIVPKKLQRKATEWYHTNLLHPGETRTELTIGQHYHWVGLRKTVANVCGKCHDCQINKVHHLKVGHVPPKLPEITPWKTLCVDLIGPYTIGPEPTKMEKKKGISRQATLHCLTMIDPATGWFEIVEVPNKRADEIANLVEQTWLTRYPWPEQVIMDRGTEFMAEVKDMLKNDYGITRKPITTRNPQANAMVERAHQTIGNMINTQGFKSKDDIPDGWAGTLAALGFAMRATVHTTTRATPSQLVFARDAILNTKFEANWQLIKERKQRIIQQNNMRENKKRIPYTYQVNDKVIVKQDPNRKFGDDKYKGPYTVSQVFDNGTVKLEQSTPSGGVVYQTWNIRNVFPYKA